MDELVKVFKSEVKVINEKKYTADMIMSTERKDRDGEIILLSSWGKHLPTFMKHPVLLDNHRMGTTADILGKFSDIAVSDSEGLIAKANYFVEQEKKETPNKESVRWAWVLVMNDLAAYSVRFIPHAAVRGEDLSSLPAGIIPDKVAELDPYRVFTEVELVETSQVTVPSNADALLRSIEGFEEAKAHVELSIAKGVFDKGLLQLPRKTFIIGSSMGKKDKGRDVLRIRCSVDSEGLARYVEEAKKTTKADVDEKGIAKFLDFEFVGSLGDEAEIVEIKGVPATVEETEDAPVEEQASGEPESEDDEGYSEADLDRIGKALGFASDDNDGFTADELKALEGKLKAAYGSSEAEDPEGASVPKSSAVDSYVERFKKIFGTLD